MSIFGTSEDKPAVRSKRWLCRIIGHDYHPEAAEYYNIYDCLRCGHNDYEAGWLETLRWKFKIWRNDRIDYLRKRWNPCPDCGGRFGRHDDNVPHIPF